MMFIVNTLDVIGLNICLEHKYNGKIFDPWASHQYKNKFTMNQYRTLISIIAKDTQLIEINIYTEVGDSFEPFCLN